MTAAGKNRARADLMAAKSAATPAGGSTSPPPPPPPPKYLTSRFHVKDDGVWMDRSDSDKPQLWIGPRLEPLAETEDEDGYFGMEWAWRDRFGNQCREVFARELFAGDAGEVCRALAARGWTSNPSREAKQALVEYLALASTTVRARVVSRPGWHKIGAATVYLMPDGAVIGRPPVRVILQSRSREAHLYQASGTLAEWRAQVSEMSIGNSRPGFAVSMGFASALLHLVGEDSGGVNVYGDSRSGKSTCGLCSVSVYGGDPSGGGARAAMRSWRLTSNSTEAIAAASSDRGLVLDELSQIDGREIGSVSYMLSSGQGKGRMDKSTQLRGMTTWRLLFLSTGELTLADKMAEVKQAARAGQAVRLIDLPADAGAGLGAFNELHDAANANDFAQRLKNGTTRFFGTAFPVFIAYIVDRLERDAVAFQDHLREEVTRITAKWLARHGGHSGQVGTVARKFALVAVAGNLATDAGATGWGLNGDNEREAEWACRVCFEAWLAERGTTGNFEDAQALMQLSNFISRHGAARFERWQDRDADPAQQGEPEAEEPKERYPTQHRAGWKKWVHGEWLFYLSAEGLHDALSGLSFIGAVKTLVAGGWILPGPGGKNSHSLKVPGAAKQRLYVVPSAIMSATAGQRAADG